MPAASFDGVNIQGCHLHFSGGSTKFPAQPRQACSTSRPCQAKPNTEAEARPQRNLGRLGHSKTAKLEPKKFDARAERPGKIRKVEDINPMKLYTLNHLHTKPSLQAHLSVLQALCPVSRMPTIAKALRPASRSPMFSEDPCLKNPIFAHLCQVSHKSQRWSQVHPRE